MTRRAADLGLKGPKGLIVFALLKLGVEVDPQDRRALRRMDAEGDPAPEVAAPQPQRTSPSSGSNRCDDGRRYNVRLEFARATELAMTRKAGLLGLKGPKTLIVFALVKLGVDVDPKDRRVLRRMDADLAD